MGRPELKTKKPSPLLGVPAPAGHVQPDMLYADLLDKQMNSSSTPPVQDRWLSVEELASYLGIKRDTVYKWIARRNMPAHKVGRLWKFRKEEIDGWVRSGAASGQDK